MTTVPTGEIDKHKLVNLMVGRELKDLFPPRNAAIGDVVLSAENIRAVPRVNGVSFSVRAGEVVGFSGLVGVGRTETMRAIFGADKMDSGKILYCGKDTHFKDPKDAVKHKFGMLSEDRKNEGVLLEQSIRMNVTIAALDKVTDRTGFILSLIHIYRQRFQMQGIAGRGRGLYQLGICGGYTAQLGINGRKLCTTEIL